MKKGKIKNIKKEEKKKEKKEKSIINFCHVLYIALVTLRSFLYKWNLVICNRVLSYYC